MSRLEWIKKIMIIVIGSVVAAYGITPALYAGFGGATLAVLRQGISETFHVSIGMASMIVAIIMITFAFFYDRSQIHIGTILYQIVYSFCVDLFASMHVYSAHLWVNALIMLLGKILFAMGTGIYAAASLGRGSYEVLTFILSGPVIQFTVLKTKKYLISESRLCYNEGKVNWRLMKIYE